MLFMRVHEKLTQFEVAKQIMQMKLKSDFN